MLLEWSTSINRRDFVHTLREQPLCTSPLFSSSLSLTRSFSFNTIKSQTKYWLWV